MSRTVTISLSQHLARRFEHVGDAQLARLITNFLRTHAISEAELDAEYAAMAADEEHEREAMEWIEFAPDEGLEDIDDDWSWFKKSPTAGAKDDVGV